MGLSKPEPNRMKIYKYSNETESFKPEKPQIRIYPNQIRMNIQTSTPK